ncbi:MAG TPA: DUF2723 domain-containing protein, partial [Chitinophagaceae bacterium]|nr:DUF2723 domain-containing protein [Chitinophagaceae bacterium]
TREARGSLWDCGEFISSADKMQLPHPPGAPTFTILGRFFIILFGDKGTTAASAVNFMSALASAATILFIFWSITHFARKMFVKAGEELSGNQLFTVMSAGVIGGLVYTFSDSFWFSAVEGEVYALSSFFTALVFWGMLKWEHADERAGVDPAAKARADRWVVFLFFMMGLSIGVHLLNLLVIPAIVMIYFFRRNFKQDATQADFTKFKKDKVIQWDAIIAIPLVLLMVVISAKNKEKDLTGFAMFIAVAAIVIALIRIYMKYKSLRNIITAFLIGCIVTGIVQLGVIQYSMKSAGLFDVFFVNSIGLPFFSGFAFYFIALAVVLAWAIRFNEKTATRKNMMIWFIIFLSLFTLPFFTTTGSVGLQILKFMLIGGIGALAGYYFNPSGLKILKLSLWSFAFMMLGYCLYFTCLIRSNANPAIDMNDVNNPVNLVYYLSREQYGSAPLLYGQHFLADVMRDEKGYAVKKYGEMRYVKGKNKYIEIGKAENYKYKSEDKQFFPRVWDGTNDQGHFDTYIEWLDIPKIEAPELCMVMGVGEGVVQTQNREGKTQTYNIEPNYSIRVRQGQVLSPGERIAIKKPTYGDSFNWFFSYQFSYMYWRYFMWNFSGKQNDNQGTSTKRDGNWITGYPFIDNKRLGDQDKLPDSLKQNKAHNKLFMLPFILGIIGCVYHFLKNRKDWIVNFLLFFFTGIAVVIYLNQPGNQPRERDYAYVGSFYAFAIWIGLGVVALVRLAREKADKMSFQNTLVYGGILTFLISILSTITDSFGGVVMTSIYSTALYAIALTLLTYLFRSLSSGGQNGRSLNIAALIICAVIPFIMARQEWDDHDRSKKTMAPDIAKDYLESCAPNAIIFTFGDNDTYPLWYAQEVEGVRPDIRIINNSLLGIDWYINQLRYKINDADSVDVIWSPEQIEGGNREVMYFDPGTVPQDRYYPLYDAMKNVLGKYTPDPETKRDKGPETYPIKKFSVPVDTMLVKKNGTVNPDDIVVPEIRFEIPKSYMQRNDLAILNIIASNNWKRPIYFTSPFSELGFGEYLRKDGLSYRLIPVAN